VIAEPRSAGGVRRFLLARWGFLPGFVKDPRNFPLIINARAETLAAKPSFRAAVIRRRCLAIADGFYEWRRETRPGAGRGSARRPYLIRRIGREPMGFAGLYETWSDPSGGEIDTACIVTTPANRSIAALSERMPAILDPRDFAAWLDVDGVGAARAIELLKPAPEAALEFIEIGPAVNHAANDDEGVQKPLE
jgi:putative SOS response-associated peptidase YedK